LLVSQNHLNCFGKVLTNEIGFGIGIFLVGVGVTTQEQTGMAAGVNAGLDVLASVADKPRVLEIDVVALLSA
jgi:hypothetical protein